MTEEKELHALLVDIYENRGDDISISPSWMATQALVELDPDQISPSRVYAAAHLELRQIARSICRKKAEPDGNPEDQHELFPNLQRRYPEARTAGSEDPQYKLLEHLTEEDVAFNLGRLRAEASAKLAHADALEAWWQNRSTKQITFLD